VGNNTYTLTATDVNGDSSTCTATVSVEAGRSLPPEWSASDIFTLAFPEALPGKTTATLRNQIGQVVEQRQLQPGEVTAEWNRSVLPGGLYFIEVWQEGLGPSGTEPPGMGKC